MWLNGCWVGAAKDSRLPSEWEVTALLRPRDNLLAVQVGGWRSTAVAPSRRAPSARVGASVADRVPPRLSGGALE